MGDMIMTPELRSNNNMKYYFVCLQSPPPPSLIKRAGYREEGQNV